MPRNIKFRMGGGVLQTDTQTDNCTSQSDIKVTTCCSKVWPKIRPFSAFNLLWVFGLISTFLGSLPHHVNAYRNHEGKLREFCAALQWGLGLVLYHFWGPRVIIYNPPFLDFFLSSFFMKCWVEIDFGTLSFFVDAEMKLYFIVVRRVENGIRVY